MAETMRSVMLLCIGVWVGACAPYVNVPPQAGDVALHNTNLKTVQNITVEAVRSVTERRPLGPYTLVLPPGTTPQTYAAVTARIGEDATTEVLPDRPIIEVRQIRVRADRAEVDVIQPGNLGEPRGPGQLVTVSLRREPFMGWNTHRLHAYTTFTTLNVPDSDYATAPPPVEEAVDEEYLDESAYEQVEPHGDDAASDEQSADE